MTKSTYWLVVLTILTGTIFSGCTTTPSTVTTIDENATTEPVNETTTPTTETNTNVTTTTPQEENKTTYKDGTYTQEGSYQRPEGTDAIKVTVTVKNDKVASVQVVGEGDNPKTKIFQKLFIEGIDQVVVGKSLGEIGELGQVNGSSLTPNGFEVAIEAIKKEATA